MTPTDIISQAREQYNATGDNFFSDTMLYRLIYQAQKQLALHSHCIEKTYTTTSVADQREYEYPNKAIAIKRVEYAGLKLQPIDFRLEDTLSLGSETSNITSDPKYYSVWNDTLYLFPTPDTSSDTITIYTYDLPDEVESTSVLDVPLRYHMDIVTFLLANMYFKDKDFGAYNMLKNEWQGVIDKAVKYEKKRLRGDSMAQVKNEDDLDVTIIGAI